MTRINFYTLFIILLFPLSVVAGDNQIKSAESAGPPDLASNATIKNWDGKSFVKAVTAGLVCRICQAHRKTIPGALTNLGQIF